MHDLTRTPKAPPKPRDRFQSLPVPTFWHAHACLYHELRMTCFLVLSVRHLGFTYTVAMQKRLDL